MADEPNDATSGGEQPEGPGAQDPSAGEREGPARGTDETAAEPSAPVRPVREMTGVVTSSKPDKTITVRVDRRVRHPVYGKFIRRSTRLAAHDETNACAEGDTVTIRQTRPISKTKRWVLGRIVARNGA